MGFRMVQLHSHMPSNRGKIINLPTISFGRESSRGRYLSELRFLAMSGVSPKWAILGNSPWELNGILEYIFWRWSSPATSKDNLEGWHILLNLSKMFVCFCLLGGYCNKQVSFGIETTGYPPWTTVCLPVHPNMRERNRLTIDHGYLGPHFFKVPELNYIDLHILGMSEVHRTQWIQWGYCNWNQFMYSFKHTNTG